MVYGESDVRVAFIISPYFFERIRSILARKFFFNKFVFNKIKMSLEQRNKKVTDVYEKYKIAEWGNGPRRTVSGF